MANRLLTGALVISTSIAAAALLNPDAEAHRARYSEAVSASSELASALKLGNLAALTTKYHSLRIASYSTANGEVVTVGAFGMVMAWESGENS